MGSPPVNGVSRSGAINTPSTPSPFRPAQRRDLVDDAFIFFGWEKVGPKPFDQPTGEIQAVAQTCKAMPSNRRLQEPCNNLKILGMRRQNLQTEILDEAPIGSIAVLIADLGLTLRAARFMTRVP